MNPRERYEVADRLLGRWEATGHPQLLAQAEAHTRAAEQHLATCPHAALEVADACPV